MLANRSYGILFPGCAFLLNCFEQVFIDCRAFMKLRLFPPVRLTYDYGVESPMFYPQMIEDWWLQFATTAAQCPDVAQSIACLESETIRLSDRFTVERPSSFDDYTANPRTLAAYGVFFFPQTFVRALYVLRACINHRISKKNWNIMDIGSGTGASSLATLLFLQEHATWMTAVDYSSHALAAQKKLFSDCRALWPKASLETRVCDARADGLTDSFDLILGSFVVNELFYECNDTALEDWMRKQIERLVPGGILILIEPAGQKTSERLQRMRNVFRTDTSIHIVAPCAHRLACPMINSGHGYCHDVRSWIVPDSVTLLNRNMLRSINDLKYSLLALLRTDPLMPVEAPGSDVFRMVAPMNRTKGRLVTRGCCADGQLREIEIQTRGLTRAQTNAICAWERGDLLHMINGKPIGDGRTHRVTGFESTFTATQEPRNSASGLVNEPENNIL